MRTLKQGTSVEGSSDPRTVEQNAWLNGDPDKGIPKHTCVSSSEVRSEYRGGVLTAAGLFTFDHTIINRDGNTPEADAEIDAAIAAGGDPSKLSGGVVILLNNEGRRDQYAGCLPSREVCQAIIDGNGEMADFLRAAIVDAVPMVDLIALRAAVVVAPADELFEPEPVAAEPVAEPVVEPEPAVVGHIEPAAPEAPAEAAESAEASVPAFPHDVAAAHPLDAHAKDTVITKTTAEGYGVQHAPPSNEGDRGPASSDGNPIPKGDVLEHLPVGSKIIVGNEGDQKVVLTVPPSGERTGPLVTFGHNLHSAVSSAWAWLVKEGHAAVAAIEKL
ncbi:MAG TPA: hypothetical protein VF787_03405 [Thermoanaerobaculia bacterium]